jgi:S1-C subfamily serine protease
MSKASVRYLLIAALACGAFVVVVVWNLQQRAAVERAPGAEGASARVTTAPVNTNAPAVGWAPATPTGAVASAGVASRVPDSVVPSVEPALPPPEVRQLAKIAHGLRANPAGGLLVEATPPWCVVGQLRLQPGDVILSVDGVAATTPEEFALAYRERGLPRELTILRDGTEFHLH